MKYSKPANNSNPTGNNRWEGIRFPGLPYIEIVQSLRKITRCVKGQESMVPLQEIEASAR
jgi:hypothetical protein